MQNLCRKTEKICRKICRKMCRKCANHTQQICIIREKKAEKCAENTKTSAENMHTSNYTDRVKLSGSNLCSPKMKK